MDLSNMAKDLGAEAASKVTDAAHSATARVAEAAYVADGKLGEAKEAVVAAGFHLTDSAADKAVDKTKDLLGH